MTHLSCDPSAPEHAVRPLRTGAALFVCLALGCGNATVWAQQPAASQPSTALALVQGHRPAAGDSKSYNKYFVFHKAGVSQNEARSDLEFCYKFVSDVEMLRKMPKFVALNQEALRRTDKGYPYTYGSGLVDTLIYGAAISALNNRIIRVNWRKCMGFKGYQRYGVSKEIWSRLNGGTTASAIDALSRVASAPTFNLPRLSP